MLKYLIQSNNFTFIPTIVLLVFMTLLLGVFIWTYRPGSKTYYKFIALSIFDLGAKKDGKP